MLANDRRVITGWRQGMAERYEVVIDFSGLKAGEKVTLLNSAASGDMGQVHAVRLQRQRGAEQARSRPR